MAWFLSLLQSLSGSERAWSTFWKLSARLWRTPPSPPPPYPQPGSPVWPPRRTHARFRDLLWGPARHAFHPDPQPQASEAAGLAGHDPFISRARWQGLLPEALGPSLHAQYVRAPDRSSQDPLVLEARKNNAETYGLNKWRENDRKTHFFSC